MKIIGGIKMEKEKRGKLLIPKELTIELSIIMAITGILIFALVGTGAL